jgi:hypothetical protein
MSYLYDPTGASVPAARVLCSAEGEGQPAGGAPAAAAAGSSSAPASGSGSQPSAEQLKELMARERETAVREVLKQLGFKTVDEAAGALKRGKELENANKTELERLREAAAKVEPLSQESNTLRGAVEQYLKAEIEALPEDKRALVDELGPPADQPAARLEWLAKAKKKGLFTAAAPAAPAAAATEQRPANTRAGAGAPPPPAANQAPQKKRPIEMTPAERQQALASYQAEQASRATPR